MLDFTVAMAQLAGGRSQFDRAYVGDGYVVVLDGASPYRPVRVNVSTYVDTLGSTIVRSMHAQPTRALPEILATAIAETRDHLGLVPHKSPSSAVAVARTNSTTIDFLVLGDCLIATPSSSMVDHRLETVATSERYQYQERLREGGGYDDVHKDLLKNLQAAQVRHRNTVDGYWIAEAESEAAYHAFSETRSLDEIPWFTVSTDGAYDALERLGLADWEHLSTLNSGSLTQLLKTCHNAEEIDSNGDRWPRAKRHDDKTIVVARRRCSAGTDGEDAAASEAGIDAGLCGKYECVGVDGGAKAAGDGVRGGQCLPVGGGWRDDGGAVVG